MPERADTLGKTVIPSFTTYLRDLTRFHEYQRELLQVATDADRQR